MKTEPRREVKSNTRGIIKFLFKYFASATCRRSPSRHQKPRNFAFSFVLCCWHSFEWRLFNYPSICTYSRFNWNVLPRFRVKLLKLFSELTNKKLFSTEKVFSKRLNLLSNTCLNKRGCYPESLMSFFFSWKNWKTFSHHSVLIGFCLLISFFLHFRF